MNNLIYQEIEKTIEKEEQNKEHINKLTGNFIMKIIGLILIFFVILYLTIYRYGIAGKLFKNNEKLAGLAILSPEISSLLGYALL